MIGVELVRDRQTKGPDVPLTRHVLASLRAAGILISIGGSSGSVVRIVPPLTITPTEIDRFVEALDGALRQRPAATARALG